MDKNQNREIYKNNKLVKLKISEIKENTCQPRKSFDNNSIELLAESIRQNGLLQPVSVRKTAGGYMLIAGERRLRALKFLGEKFVPAIIINADEDQSAVLALVENIHRQDLNIFEQAEAIDMLIERWGVTQSVAAKRLGMSQPAVANKLRLLKFGQEERRKICEKNLLERHARAIIRIDDQKKREQAIRYVCSHNLNVSQTEKYVDRLICCEKKGETKLVFKDLRIFINTINMAIETMRRSGVMASAVKGETDKFIEYTIKIPKPAVNSQRS